MKRLAVLLWACLAASFAQAQDALTVQDAWVRVVPGSTVASVYFTLRNGGKQTVAVTGVESPLAHAMLHESIVENGLSRMRHRDKVEVPPGQVVKFEPGGLHVMLHGLQGEVEAGQRVPVVLVLSTGEKLSVTAEVRPLGAP